jgi:transcriptional regulator GlxA family with amidase domain
LGVVDLYQNREYLNRIHLNPEKQWIGSMCSGAILLAALGLLSGDATTYPTSVERLRSFGINVVNKSLVINDRIATAAGCLAAEKLSCWMITNLHGEDMVGRVRESILPLDEVSNS